MFIHLSFEFEKEGQQLWHTTHININQLNEAPLSNSPVGTPPTACVLDTDHLHRSKSFLDLVQSFVVLQQTRKLPPVLADRGRKGEMCNGVIFTSCKSRLCSSVCREGEGLVNIMSENFRFSTKSIFACHFLGNSSIIYKQSANMVFPFTAYSSGSSLSEGC